MLFRPVSFGIRLGMLSGHFVVAAARRKAFVFAYGSNLRLFRACYFEIVKITTCSTACIWQRRLGERMNEMTCVLFKV